MNFISSYKHLEKLCREQFGDSRGVTAYIDEMQNIPDGFRYVKNWDNYLKQLKHYRWMRNKIAHDPDFTEENTCTPEDEQWLDNFYASIMNQTDPLALYLKATSKQTQNYKPPTPYKPSPTPTNSNKRPNRTIAFLLLIISALIFTATILLCTR